MSFYSTALWLLALSSSARAYNYSTVAEHCEDLWNFTGDAGLEAPTVVTNVTFIPGANSSQGYTPAYCSVTAYVQNYTGILLYFPAEGKDWKGIFSSHGCGGSCGVMGLDYVYGYGSGPYGADLLRRGYIASMTDMGHENGVNDTVSSWAQFRNNRTVEYNFAFYSTHLLAVAGKAMAEYYYAEPPSHSFWRGGSTGGRQGAMIAQRFPHDYNAILIAYAALNETGIGAIQFPWLAKSSMYSNGSLIFTDADVYSLHYGAVDACDANDGLIDGIVDPRYNCSFDPITILCTENFTSNCLSTMDKVTAARAMYAFPSNSFDDNLFNSRYVPGSELEWLTWTSIYGYDFAFSFTQNAAFQTDLPENFTLAEYDWETMPYQTGYMEDLYSAFDADLSIFRDRGGKIIHYQGLADGNVAPMLNMHYYEKVINQMGGLAAVQDFYRFFAYPGMAHIDVSNNSQVAWQCEYYDYLENWFFNDVAPDSLLIHHVNVSSNATIDYRLYYPYPLTPFWNGTQEEYEARLGTEVDVEKWIGVEISAEKLGIV